MLTRFLGTNNWQGLSASYTFDDQLDFANNKIQIDGDLTTTFTNVLSNVNDFKKNNYSHLFLTKPLNFADITDFTSPNKISTVHFGLLAITAENNRDFYVKFTDELDNTFGTYELYDQTVATRLSSIDDSNFFEIDVTDPLVATIAHYYNTKKYFLCFNPTNLNLNMMAEDNFNEVLDYTRKFYYSFDAANKIFTFQIRYQGEPFSLYRDPITRRLALTGTNTISFNDSKKIFKITTFLDPDLPEITNDWLSYEDSLNQNNININTTESYFGIKNNFLLHSEFGNLTESGFVSNIITLKNQLNSKYKQGRGGIGEGEEINYRNYHSIYSGGRQEKGHEKLHLGYGCYTTPYTFKQGQTTWFHMPQNMFPYAKLNVNTTGLVKAGAIAGDHPLRSDKIWKKLGNYKYTSNMGSAQEEQTGQWLCTWLSGGSNINTEPVWVDRYYNPQTTTAYQAIQAQADNLTYITSIECYGLPNGVIDVKSSLTFEPGSLYAYSHIGKVDADQNVNVLKAALQQENFSNYKLYNSQEIDPETDQTGTPLYVFDGNRYAYFDVDTFNTPLNNFSIAFWGNSTDWSRPMGYELGGNYMDYGFGIFNHHTVTPFLFYFNGGRLVSINQDLEILNTFDTGVSAYGNFQFLLRRDPLNSFHIITDAQQLTEFDLKETITDATSALSGRIGIKHASNDLTHGYVLYNNNTISKVDLVSNLLVPAVTGVVIGRNADLREIRKLNDNRIALIGGTQSLVRGDNLYFLSAGGIKVYNSQTNLLSSYIGAIGESYTCFNIDRYSNTWVASANTIKVFGQRQEFLFDTRLTVASSYSTAPVVIYNITFTENFNKGELVTNAIVAASGSSGNDTILFKMDYQGNVDKTLVIDTFGDMRLNRDPSNHIFNYSYLQPAYPDKEFTFKIRLFNQFNSEEISIPQVSVSATDLNPGWHHFAINVNCPRGILELYVDGELYDQDMFTPNQYNFTPLIIDRVYVGATTFYNGLLLNDALYKSKAKAASYFVKDLNLQYFYFFAKSLNYYDVNMLYKQKTSPTDLVWDVPNGRRNYIDTISRYFRQKVPGAKSTLFNLYISDNLLDQPSKDFVSTAITSKIKEIIPAYSKLNNIVWVTNTLSQSADYVRPFQSGNIILGRENE